MTRRRPRDDGSHEPQVSTRQMLRLFLNERRDPAPFHAELARRTIGDLPLDAAESLAGQRVVDLGCGPGAYTRALRTAGATVLPIDLDPSEFTLPGGPPGGEMLASGAALPLRDGSVDGIVCSNMIEHTPQPRHVLDEMQRVVRPGGWVWLSWTNWLSPWGGHDMSPFHYLGPRVGTRVYRLVTKRSPKNEPLRTLFPLSISTVLDDLARRPAFSVLSVRPRYYPSLRWVVRVRGVREVLTWNCVVRLKRVPSPSDRAP